MTIDLWLLVVLAALAAYRLTRLVTTDKFTEGLRARIWQRWPDDDTLYPDDGLVRQDPDDAALGYTTHGVAVFYDDSDRDYPGWRPVSPTMIGYLVGCDYCVSVWVSLLVVVPVGLTLGFGWWVILGWWAVAGLVSVLVKYA